MTKDKIIEAFENLRYFESTDEAEWGRVLAEADRAIEALKKGQSLPIDSVSHQRELLKSFCKYIDLESRAHHDDIKIDIENHLKIFNCG